LDAVWVSFHENKHIFIDLGIRDHFNISKLHNIKHYLDSIRELGSAVGYNTEGTERLHIDFAKLGYRASNKKNHHKQMTRWLQRQEGIHRFRLYLELVHTGSAYVADKRSSHGESENGSSAGSDDDSHVNVNQTFPQHQASFRVAKKPAFPQLTLDSIASDFGINSLDFTSQLSIFFRDHPLLSKLSSQRRLQLFESINTFPVYRRLYLSLPSIPEVSSSECILKDTVIATRRKAGVITTRGIKKASPARFSTVLVREGHAPDPSKDPLNGMLRVLLVYLFTNELW
ncbi:hypothetical protein H0H92_011026, partial [Tricholoma furcatifolium]